MDSESKRTRSRFGSASNLLSFHIYTFFQPPENQERVGWFGLVHECCLETNRHLNFKAVSAEGVLLLEVFSKNIS